MSKKKCHCDKSFSSSFMLLNPEEVGLFDLIKILFSSNIGKRKFVDSSYVKESDLKQRWIMFLSICIQKFLLFIEKPLWMIGSVIEFCLNFLTMNGGFTGLLFNILKVKLVIPHRESAEYSTCCGFMDYRKELDTNIKLGDDRYPAVLSMMAAKLSYENKAHIENVVKNNWKMEFIGAYDFWNEYQEKATTQACLLNNKNHDQETIVVAFRGTEPFDSYAWCSDFDLSWYEINHTGRKMKIHGGFMKALGLQKCHGWPKNLEQSAEREAPVAYYAIRNMLKELLSKNENAKFIVSGHSLGGALAILFPTVLILHEETWLLDRLEGVYTFGQPRVGDRNFAEFMDNKLKEHQINYFRFVYGNDMVPRLPFDDRELMFKHFGKCLYYDSQYEGQVLIQLPNKNYFNPFLAIPMTMTACGELIRSFILPYRKGPEYTEGWFMRLVRIFGLLFPGIPVHFPQDYVNSTRLGSPHVYTRLKTL